MKAQSAYMADTNNPLDGVEEILMRNDWMYDRNNDDELVVQVAGKFCNYQMIFKWQKEFETMQFVCEYDIIVPTARMSEAAPILRSMNEKTFLGHFEVPDDTQCPRFRYTSIFRSHSPHSSTDYIADLVEIAMQQCEQNYSLFEILTSSIVINDDVVNLALNTTAGRA